jgi:hypothetical protein
MTGYRRWRDSGHPDRAIDTAGGPEAFEAELHRLADMRRRHVPAVGDLLGAGSHPARIQAVEVENEVVRGFM